MKQRFIKSLIKSGLKRVSFDEYLSTSETNIFAISDKKGLLYLNVNGKNFVITFNLMFAASFFAYEMKVNNKKNLYESAEESDFILTESGIHFTCKQKEINRIYNKEYSLFMLKRL